ncbi:MAG: hypothetical protein FJ225_05255 [Lentisphaerae bacterium]|nr:hypothetical protein [Lentisphaerota bacterium]
MNTLERSAAVAAAVWPWRERKNTGGARENAGVRRRRALIEAAAAAGAGALLLLVFHKTVIAAIAFSAAGIVAVGGLFVPPLYRAFRRGGLLLAKGAGVALTWILLAPFFYICFTFARAVLVLLGKDPLARKCPGAEKSYWHARKPVSGPEHYTRQY